MSATAATTDTKTQLAAAIEQLTKATSSATVAAHHLEEAVKSTQPSQNQPQKPKETLDQLKKFLASHIQFEKVILDLPVEQMKHYELLIGDLRTGMIPKNILQNTLRDHLPKVPDTFITLSMEHAGVIAVGFAEYYPNIRREYALKALGFEEPPIKSTKPKKGKKRR